MEGATESQPGRRDGEQCVKGAALGQRSGEASGRGGVSAEFSDGERKSVRQGTGDMDGALAAKWGELGMFEEQPDACGTGAEWEKQGVGQERRPP